MSTDINEFLFNCILAGFQHLFSRWPVLFMNSNINARYISQRGSLCFLFRIQQAEEQFYNRLSGPKGMPLVVCNHHGA